MKKQKNEIKDKSLLEIMKEKGEKVSKASRVRTLLQKHRSLLKTKEALTDFKEPVLDLYRRNGQIETYENATAGKFLFTHSNGKERYIDLRPSDQCTRDYAGKKIRWYIAHEDRPFAGFENPIVDGESVQLGYEKTKATDLKYQERIQRLQNKAKLTWVWIVLGIAAAVAVVMFAWSTWIAPAQKANTVAQSAPPVAGIIFLSSKNWIKKIKRKFKK